MEAAIQRRLNPDIMSAQEAGDSRAEAMHKLPAKQDVYRTIIRHAQQLFKPDHAIRAVTVPGESMDFEQQLLEAFPNARLMFIERREWVFGGLHARAVAAGVYGSVDHMVMVNLSSNKKTPGVNKVLGPKNPDWIFNATTYAEILQQADVLYLDVMSNPSKPVVDMFTSIVNGRKAEIGVLSFSMVLGRTADPVTDPMGVIHKESVLPTSKYMISQYNAPNDKGGKDILTGVLGAYRKPRKQLVSRPNWEVA